MSQEDTKYLRTDFYLEQILGCFEIITYNCTLCKQLIISKLLNYFLLSTYVQDNVKDENLIKCNAQQI